VFLKRLSSAEIRWRIYAGTSGYRAAELRLNRLSSAGATGSVSFEGVIGITFYGFWRRLAEACRIQLPAVEQDTLTSAGTHWKDLSGAD